MKDCCDCEIIAWVALFGCSLLRDPVRDMISKAAEASFGSTDKRVIEVEFLMVKGYAYRAIETHVFVHELGIKPVHTSVNSLQSHGIAESCVNTSKKRDYAGWMAYGKQGRRDGLAAPRIRAEHICTFKQEQ